MTEKQSNPYTMANLAGFTELKRYTTDEWYDVAASLECCPRLPVECSCPMAVVIIDTDELPELGETVEINKEWFVVTGIEKHAIHIASWKGKTVGLLVAALVEAKSSQEKSTCVDCGKLFTSMDPPAETREDDPEPRCRSCIENESVKEEPLDDEEIEDIVAKLFRD